MTFREKLTTRFYAFALAAVFALALAGCGGGGGGTAQMPDTGQMPDPQMECEGDGGRWNADMTCTTAAELVMEMQAAERGAISTAITAATNAVAAVNDDSTDAEVAAADAAIAAANMAIADAANLPDEEKAANSGTVSAIAGRLTAAKASRTTAMEAAEDAARMARNAMALKLRAGLGPSFDAATRPSVSSLTITGSSITGTFDTDGSGSEPAEAELTVRASGEATPAAGGWSGTDYVHTSADGVINHAVAYSNPSAPNVVPFEEKHAGIIDDSLGGIPLSAFGTFKITGSGLASGAGSKTHTVPTDADYVSVRGTFDGAQGSFRCSAACVSAVDESTGVKFTGTWWFVGDDGATTSTPDTSFVRFGWWARDAGDDGVRVAPFAFPGNVTASSNIEAVEGTATYAGGAAGKVSIYDPLADVNNAAGAFTADATFTVDFGSETADDGTISGTIDNFSVEGEAKDWSVALRETAITDSSGSFTNAASGTTWTIGGTAASNSGDWVGTFYDTDAASGVPKSLIGQFRAQYRNIGRMVGSFGADKQ